MSRAAPQELNSRCFYSDRRFSSGGGRATGSFYPLKCDELVRCPVAFIFGAPFGENFVDRGEVFIVRSQATTLLEAALADPSGAYVTTYLAYRRTS